MMPTFALVGVPGPRWLPPFPVPLFLLWPFVLVCMGIARLLDVATLRVAMQVFRELHGLAIDVENADRKGVRIRFI